LHSIKLAKPCQGLKFFAAIPVGSGFDLKDLLHKSPVNKMLV
jgi:hypothetical protein